MGLGFSVIKGDSTKACKEGIAPGVVGLGIGFRNGSESKAIFQICTPLRLQQFRTKVVGVGIISNIIPLESVHKYRLSYNIL